MEFTFRKTKQEAKSNRQDSFDFWNFIFYQYVYTQPLYNWQYLTLSLFQTVIDKDLSRKRTFIDKLENTFSCFPIFKNGP